MKRAGVALLAAAGLFGLTACGGGAGDASAPAPTVTVTQTAPEPDPEPAVTVTETVTHTKEAGPSKPDGWGLLESAWWTQSAKDRQSMCDGWNLGPTMQDELIQTFEDSSEQMVPAETARQFFEEKC